HVWPCMLHNLIINTYGAPHHYKALILHNSLVDNEWTGEFFATYQLFRRREIVIWNLCCTAICAFLRRERRVIAGSRQGQRPRWRRALLHPSSLYRAEKGPRQWRQQTIFTRRARPCPSTARSPLNRSIDRCNAAQFQVDQSFSAAPRASLISSLKSAASWWGSSSDVSDALWAFGSR